MGHSSLVRIDRTQTEPAGRDTASLGPSDSSDSGSDLQGAPDVEDANLDSDSDSGGTGERASAERDTVVDGADIGTDHIEYLPEAEAFEDEGAPKRKRH
jgi:hypothetical protein